MAQEGGIVFVCSIDNNIQEAVQKLSKDGKYKVEGMHCDVTNKNHRQEVLRYIEENHGRLDVLVLNAGISGLLGR